MYADSGKANLGYIFNRELMGFADRFDWNVDKDIKNDSGFLLEPLGG